MKPKINMSIFNFTDWEMQCYPFLRRYQNRILSKIDRISLNKYQLNRYIVVSLFVSYRICNNNGVNLSEKNLDFLDDLNAMRLTQANSVLDQPITSTKQYLSYLFGKFGIFCFRFFPATYLYYFVMTRQTLNR